MIQDARGRLLVSCYWKEQGTRSKEQGAEGREQRIREEAAAVEVRRSKAESDRFGRKGRGAEGGEQRAEGTQ